MRILFADDDPAIQALLKLALEKLGGHTTCVCSSGSMALKEAPKFAPDLILLDVAMPLMNGPETFNALIQMPEMASIPVIFLTANSVEGEIAALKNLGAKGVIMKPFDPMMLSKTIADILREPGIQSASGINEQMKSMQEAYAGELAEKIGEIQKISEILLQGPWDDASAEHMQRLLHTIIGTGGSFGFYEVSSQARVVEDILKSVRSRDGDITSELKIQMQALLDSQRSPCGDGWAPCRKEASSSVSGRQQVKQNDSRLVLLIGYDQDLFEELTPQLGYFGYSVSRYASFEDMSETADGAHCAAVIADSELLDRDAELIRASVDADLPLIFLSGIDTIERRLQAVRAGGDAFFPLPVNISRLIDKLDELSNQLASVPYRILIVDDEPLLSSHHELILKKAGMLTRVLNNPMRIMHDLSDFRPELILMDVYMPQCNGLELAKMIRQKDMFMSVPIVFLSAETDVDKQLRAMSLGGDDFLTKPISAAHLISSVSSRAERYRGLRTFMIRDSLTGLLNHSRTKEQLDIDVARAQRSEGSLVFAIIDIDHFKSVNDTYGHYTGDQVIKNLSRLLQQRLRKTDTVGRYGGEEFAVILADMDVSGAIKILDGIRQDFGRISHQAKEAVFSVTFSCGIAAFPAYTTAGALNEAADAALYRAKSSGRNRICLSE